MFVPFLFSFLCLFVRAFNGALTRNIDSKYVIKKILTECFDIFSSLKIMSKIVGEYVRKQHFNNIISNNINTESFT